MEPFENDSAAPFCPHLLAEQHGHLFTAGPALAIFLVLLGWMVERGAGSLLFAAAAMLFAALLKRLIRIGALPRIGWNSPGDS